MNEDVALEMIRAIGDVAACVDRRGKIEELREVEARITELARSAAAVEAWRGSAETARREGLVRVAEKLSERRDELLEALWPGVYEDEPE